MGFLSRRRHTFPLPVLATRHNTTHNKNLHIIHLQTTHRFEMEYSKYMTQLIDLPHSLVEFIHLIADRFYQLLLLVVLLFGRY